MQKIIRFFKFIALFFLFIHNTKGQNLDNELTAIIKPLIISISSQTVKNVAISDFTLLDGTPTELGKYLAEEFSFSLVNAPNKSFVVIDRSRVAALLQENNVGSTGRIDPNTIAKLGKMKGIDAIIAGTLTSTGNTLRLIIKVWNLETQGLVAASKGDISKTPMIIELESKVSTPLLSGGVTSITPITTPQLPAISKFTKDNLTFELLGCSQSGQSIECKVRVISKDKDFDLGFRGTLGRIITGSSNEYRVGDIKIGDKISEDGWDTKTLISNLPTPSQFTFPSINEKVDFIPLLEIVFHSFTLQFRNIKVK
jgi:hypothetical protein